MSNLVRRSLTVALVVGTLLVSLTPATTASPRRAEARRTVTYPGSGLDIHLGQEAGLGETSASFRAFVHHRLVRAWQATGGSEKCRPAPVVTVKTWTSDGFARVGEGTYAPCPGGGYSQLYVVRDGRWRAPVALGSQEARSCSLMKWFGVPGAVADRECYPDLGDLVSYRTYDLPAGYSTVGYAARVLAGTVEDGTGVAEDWAKPKVVDRLYAMRDDGAETFTVKRCFGPDDAEYGDVLGDATRGCLLDVFYGDYRALDVMRLYPSRFGRWATGSLEPVASS